MIDELMRTNYFGAPGQNHVPITVIIGVNPYVFITLGCWQDLLTTLK